MNERIFNRILAGRAAAVASSLPKLFGSNTLELLFSLTVYEVHHQNIKHQQHRSERNP